MTFRRTMTGLVVLLIAGLAASFYVNWRMLGQLRTVKAFVEGSVFADAVAACERAQLRQQGDQVAFEIEALVVHSR